MPPRIGWARHSSVTGLGTLPPTSAGRKKEGADPETPSIHAGTIGFSGGQEGARPDGAASDLSRSCGPRVVGEWGEARRSVGICLASRQIVP